MKKLNFNIAGVQFHKFYENQEKIKENKPVQLIPEPSNQYDKYAIRIEQSNIMLGYVPAKLSKKICNQLTFGNKLITTLTKISPKLEPWDALEVEVKVEVIK